MDHKRIAFAGREPRLAPGWSPAHHRRQMVRASGSTAEGPIHTNKLGVQKRWRHMFGGSDCEERARRYMQEHYGQIPSGQAVRRRANRTVHARSV
jgi:hypothetical protein